MAGKILNTTGNRKYWIEGGETYFAGDWCLRDASLEEVAAASGRILESPWRDPARFFEAADVIDRVCEKTLQRLADYLNATHGLDYPLRSWRLILAPWMLFFVHALYDRYRHLRSACDRLGDFRTSGVPLDTVLTPNSLRDFYGYLILDNYNLVMFSHLMGQLGIPYEPRALDVDDLAALRPPEIVDKEKYYTNDLKGRLRHARWRVLNLLHKLNARKNPVLLYRTGLSEKDAWKLMLKSAFKIGLIEFHPVSYLGVFQPEFDDRRRGLSRIGADDEFERCLADLLPRHFPPLYLEGFMQARERALKEIGRVPTDSVTAMGSWTGEHFKFIVAESFRRGGKLRLIQHGGGYGNIKRFQAEDHERMISDCFYTWGWEDAHVSGGGAVKPLPSPQLLNFESFKPMLERERNVLLITNTYSPYLYRFDTIGIQLEPFCEWRARFIAALSGEMRKRLSVRLHPGDRSPRTRALPLRFPGIALDAEKRLSSSLKQSRVAVVDHCTTSVLQLLTANLPVLFFWNPDFWKMRPEVQADFDELRRHGILHDTPESAAGFLNSNHGRIADWWSDAGLQSARARFVSRFARTDPRWRSAWLAELTRPLSVV